MLGLYLLDDDDDFDNEVETVDFMKSLYVEEKMVEMTTRNEADAQRKLLLEEMKQEKRPFYDIMSTIS